MKDRNDNDRCQQCSLNQFLGKNKIKHSNIKTIYGSV